MSRTWSYRTDKQQVRLINSYSNRPKSINSPGQIDHLENFNTAWREKPIHVSTILTFIISMAIYIGLYFSAVLVCNIIQTRPHMHYDTMHYILTYALRYFRLWWVFQLSYVHTCKHVSNFLAYVFKKPS